MLIGYARVSTNDQTTALQLDALARAGVQRTYEEKVRGRKRLHLHNLSRVVAATQQPGGPVELHVESLASGQVARLEVDFLVCATGYQPADPADVLGELGPLCLRDSTGRFRVTRDYRVLTADHVRCGVYVQGGVEQTHGLSSSLLSNVAVRAGEIVRAVVAAQGSSADMILSR